MGSYIGIGLVYDELSIEKMEREIAAVTSYFVLHGGQIKEAKYSKDKEGSLWIEDDKVNFDGNSNFFTNFVQGFFGEIHLFSNVLGKRNLEILLRLEKTEEDYFGLLIDIPEEQLLCGNSSQELELITESIVQFLKNIYKITHYDYAVCDNEAEIKYAPSKFLLLKNPVNSVALIPLLKDAGVEFKILRAPWAIDGLSERL